MLRQGSSDVFKNVVKRFLLHLLIKKTFHPCLFAEQVLLVLFGNVLLAFRQNGPGTASYAVWDPFASPAFEVTVTDFGAHLKLSNHVNPLATPSLVCLELLHCLFADFGVHTWPYIHVQTAPHQPTYRRHSRFILILIILDDFKISGGVLDNLISITVRPTKACHKGLVPRTT